MELKLTVRGVLPLVGLATHWATGGGGRVAVLGVGRYSIWAVAAAPIGMVWPPKMIDRSGVRRRNWPATVTVTWLPACSGQPVWLHDMEMSAAAIETALFLASSCTRQVTRLVAVLQAWPWAKELGDSAAWNAPSRAALLRLIVA